jgi:flagellar biosynthesis protein FlhG
MSAQLESVRAFVADSKPAPPPLPDERRAVVVGSGKGGVGTSTVASLLAFALAEQRREVLLVDAADGHGAQHLLMGIDAELGLEALHRRHADPRDVIVRVTPTLSLLPAVGGGPGAERPQPAERRALFRRIGRELDDYDVIVIDGGSRLESVLSASEAGVGVLLAVTAADRISLAATYALVKAVGMRLGERPLAVLGNRLDEASGRGAAELVDAAARHFLNRSIDYAGFLPDDACLAAGIAAGMPIQDAAAGSPAAVAMQTLAGPLLNSTSSAFARPGSRQRQPK